jgi:hypothetical protein
LDKVQKFCQHKLKNKINSEEQMVQNYQQPVYLVYLYQLHSLAFDPGKWTLHFRRRFPGSIHAGYFS